MARELNLAGTTVAYQPYGPADHASILEHAAADAVAWVRALLPLSA